MGLINTAHEHFITQTGKKSKTALKNFMGMVGQGATYGAERQHMRPRADGQEKQIPVD